MKICSNCQKSLPESEFYSRGKKRHDPQSHCKSCHSKYIQQRFRKLKIRAVEYLGNACNDCGHAFHPAAYDFHHQDPEKKEVVWAKLRKRSWNGITQELDKCLLLCAICHRLRHTDLDAYDEVIGTGTRT